MKFRLLGLGLVATTALAACQPQETAAPEPALSIERAFASPSLTGPSPRSLRFSPDGLRVTFLRAKEDDQRVLDLWAMDVDGGEP